MNERSGTSRRRPRDAARLPGDVRDVLHGGAIRAMTGADDPGSVHTAVVGDPSGRDAVTVDANKKEIRVVATDAVTEEEFTTTLIALGNAVWRKPKAGEVAVVLRPSRLHGPGQPFLLSGDGGNENDVPAKLTDTNLVISPPAGAVVVESRDDHLDLFTPTGNSKSVRANGSDFDALKTQDFLADLSTLLLDVLTELAKGTSGSPVAQQLVGLATLTTKITAFRVKLASATQFRSSKFQHG